MNYKINANENDDVNIIMRAGSDYVRTVFPKGKVIGIIGAAEKVEKSDKFDGFGICVDGEYYFAGSMTADKPKKPDEAPKAEKAEKKIEPKKTTKKTTNTKKKA